MKILTDAMKEIDDLIEDAKNNGQSTTTLVAEKVILQASIDGPEGKQSEIDAINAQIVLVNIDIASLQSELSESNYFTPELLEEKIKFEIDGEYTNESCTLYRFVFYSHR